MFSITIYFAISDDLMIQMHTEGNSSDTYQ